MNTIEKVTAILQQYPHLKYRAERYHVEVLPATENGFTVGIEAGDPEYLVYFGTSGWHAHYWHEAEALSWFAFGLSQECRLQVWSRGKTDYLWIVEQKKDADWVEVGRSISFLCPFWKKRQVRYLQNSLLEDRRLFI